MKFEITAKRLRKALSNSNMSAQELAEKSNVSKASISQYINGFHQPSNISSQKICEVLGVNPLLLMGFDVDMDIEWNTKTQEIEDAVVNDLKAYLDDFIAMLTNISPKTKKAKIRHINDVEQSMKRVDHLFEMGRISVYEYDKKISAYKEELEEAKTQVYDKPIVADSIIIDDWQVIYKKLTRQKQRIWLNQIIKEIVVDSDKNVTSIKFN